MFWAASINYFFVSSMTKLCAVFFFLVIVIIFNQSSDVSFCVAQEGQSQPSWHLPNFKMANPPLDMESSVTHPVSIVLGDQQHTVRVHYTHTVITVESRYSTIHSKLMPPVGCQPDISIHSNHISGGLSWTCHKPVANSR